MLKTIVTLVAFISAQIYVAPARAEDAVQEQFKAGVQKMQAQVELEKLKVSIKDQKDKIEKSQADLKEGIKGDLIVLNSRLDELDHLSSFLSVDSSATNAVAEASKTVEQRNNFLTASEIAAVVAVGSYGVYRIAKLPDAPEEKLTRGEKAARTRAMNQNLFNKAVATVENGANTLRNNKPLQRGASALAVLSAGVAVVAGLVAYFDGKPVRDATAATTRESLSLLVSDKKYSHLSYPQIDLALSNTGKDPALAARVNAELNTIMADTKARSAAINTKRVSILDLEQKKTALDQQYEKQKAEIDAKYSR